MQQMNEDQLRERAAIREKESRPVSAEIFVNYATREAGVRFINAAGYTGDRGLLRFEDVFSDGTSPNARSVISLAVAAIEKRGFFVTINGEKVEAPDAGWVEHDAKLTRTTLRADLAPTRAYLRMVADRYAPRATYDPRPVFDIPAGWECAPRPWDMWELTGPDGQRRSLSRRVDLQATTWTLWEGAPYSSEKTSEGPTCADAVAPLTEHLSEFDMYGVRLDLTAWSTYGIDGTVTVYGPGWWPFHQPVTRNVRPWKEAINTSQEETGETRPTSIRLSPSSKTFSWRNEYVAVYPASDGAPTATATLLLLHSRMGPTRTHQVPITVNIEDGTVSLPDSCPPHLRHEAETKGLRILTLIARGRMERRAGHRAPVATLHPMERP